MTKPTTNASTNALFSEIRALIEEARTHVARVANTALTLTYWWIGKRLLAEYMTGDRSEYVKNILETLAQQLEQEFGNGFSYSALTGRKKP